MRNSALDSIRTCFRLASAEVREAHEAEERDLEQMRMEGEQEELTAE
jgi:hypothetical protein